MKNAIREYIELTKEEKEKLWNEAVFVFDTNVFLNLYRYSEKTRNALLDSMRQLKSRIWMPKHVAIEYMGKRADIIHETENRYKILHEEKNDFIQSCQSKLRIEDDDVELNKLATNIDKWIEENRTKNLLVKNIVDDSILDSLLNLFDGKVGKGFADEELEEIYKEGQKRYDKKIPPGFKDAVKKDGEIDNNAYGDLVIWKEILAFANEKKVGIIYVTHDQKEDWWNKKHGKTIGPRVELRKEFYDASGKLFHMYSMNSYISLFKDKGSTKIDNSIIDEVYSIELSDIESAIEKERDKRLDWYFKSLMKNIENEVREKEKNNIENKIVLNSKKNDKRRQYIETLERKYDGKKMPDDIVLMIKNTKNNIEREEDEQLINLYKLFESSKKNK